MLTLQDILSQNDPEALKKLLGRNSSSVDDQPMEDASAIPTPGPTPIPEATPAPSIPAPIGMGPLSNPDDYKPSVINEYALEEESPSSMTPDQRSSMSMSSQVRGQQPSSVSPEVSRSPAEEGFTENTVENLRKAQAETARLKNFEDLNNTATILAGAAAGERYRATPTNVNDLIKIGEQKKKDADSIVTDFQARGEKEKSDPGSAASAQARSLARVMLKQAGLNINIPDNVSAADLEKRFGNFEKMADTKANIEARRELAIEREKDRKLLREESSNKKMDESDKKRFDVLSKEMDPARASGRNQLGTDAKNLAVIQNAKVLLETGDLNSIDSRQMYEVVRLLDRVVSGGSPTVSASAHLDPDTYKKQVNTFIEKLTNKRRGAEGASFLKSQLNTFNKEEERAKQRLAESAVKASSTYKDLMEKNPEKWDEMMADHGYSNILSSEKIREMREKRKADSSQPISSNTKEEKAISNISIPSDVVKKDPKIVKYASEHGLDYDKAKKILVTRGYQSSEK